MIRRDITFTVALCTSLTVHALLLAGAAELYTLRAGSHIRLPGFTSEQTIGALLIPQEQLESLRDRLGDTTGKGQATDTSPGDMPLAAQKASQDQPFLSLDPAGPGKVGDDPGDSLIPPGQNLAQPPVAMLPPTQPPLPLGVGAPAQDFSPPVAPTPGIAGSPGGSAPAADPAPQGESESDPTTIAGTADFRYGSTEVRLGRKHKITRPRLSIDARIDLMTLKTPLVVLKINIDQTGKVTRAEIFRSSGSNSVDQPCKLEAYNWWFEPAKDRNGKPVKDVILFAIRFI